MKQYVCPICGGEVTETEKFFGCSNYKEADGGCKYKIWKNIYDIKIPEKMLDELLTKGETSEKLSGFVSKKNGKEFSAYLRFNKEHNRIEYFFKNDDN